MQVKKQMMGHFPEGEEAYNASEGEKSHKDKDTTENEMSRKMAGLRVSVDEEQSSEGGKMAGFRISLAGRRRRLFG